MWGDAFGHPIEWHDWAIHGVLAGVFAAQMFPANDPAVSLIASFLAFAVGFLGRPVGAFVLSPLADEYGHRAIPSATIIIAGIGSLLIPATPLALGLAACTNIVFRLRARDAAAGHPALRHVGPSCRPAHDRNGYRNRLRTARLSAARAGMRREPPWGRRAGSSGLA